MIRACSPKGRRGAESATGERDLSCGSAEERSATPPDKRSQTESCGGRTKPCPGKWRTTKPALPLCNCRIPGKKDTRLQEKSGSERQPTVHRFRAGPAPAMRNSRVVPPAIRDSSMDGPEP